MLKAGLPVVPHSLAVIQTWLYTSCQYVQFRAGPALRVLIEKKALPLR